MSSDEEAYVSSELARSTYALVCLMREDAEDAEDGTA
jgi:hypothetical protein